MEADFQREYGIDLAPALWGPQPLTARRFQSLLHGLPLDSSLARSIDDTGRLAVGWNAQVELQAATIEMIDRHTRTYLQAQGVKKHEMPEPVVVPRPGSPTSRPKATPRAVHGFLARKGIPILPRPKNRKP